MRIRTVTMLGLALITVAACSSSATTAPASAAAKNYNLTLIQGVAGDPFYVTMACGAQAEAAKEGVTLNVTGGNKWDATVQKPVIDSVTAAHPDGVMVAPDDSKALLSPLKAMSDAGIKVTFVDTKLDDTSFAVSSIATDNLGGGTLAAKTLAQLIGDKGTVLVVNVDPGISTTDARVKGFQDEMKNHPNITVLDVQFTHDDPTAATTITTATLAAHPDLAGVFATNVQNAEGVATGLKQASNTTVKTIAFDAGPKQIEDLNNGIVQGLIAQDPYGIGVAGIQQTVLALKGQPTTATIQTQLAAITKDNVNDPAMAKYLYKATCS
ncbi:MAG: ABC transporter substrate-binding protein [Candidatus Limnocylindrales bacterium]|jgi:ribose transport system substrate-binding protein